MGTIPNCIKLTIAEVSQTVKCKYAPYNLWILQSQKTGVSLNISFNYGMLKRWLWRHQQCCCPNPVTDIMTSPAMVKIIFYNVTVKGGSGAKYVVGF